MKSVSHTDAHIQLYAHSLFSGIDYNPSSFDETKNLPNLKEYSTFVVLIFASSAPAIVRLLAK